MKLILGTILAAAALHAQPSITGDWQATLNVGPTGLHLILRITPGAGSSLKATLDSLEQNSNGIPISSIAFQDGKLTFRSDAINASYEGKLNGASIEGTFTQGQSLPLTWTRAVKPSDIDGAWEGTLDAGGQKLPLVLHLTATKDGFAASLDSPAQGARGIPVGTVKREGATLTLDLPGIGAKYRGTIAKDASEITGTFTQNGADLPLALKRQVKP